MPYASLLGVCQYPSAYTRLEMRYAMSVLSRWRTKWGKVHFAILVKSLEYGYETRKMGLKYGGALDKEKTKVLTLRNKVEDMKCVPIYLKTSEMIADIGTKALDPKLFCYLRDKLCGYWKGGKD